MLVCDCGWSGFDLIPHLDGTARCPRCLQVFVGIRAKDAIYDLDSDDFEYRTKPYMNTVKGAWVGAYNHYMQYRNHYDTSRAADRDMPCKMTGESRVWSNGITVVRRCLWGSCKACKQILREPNINEQIEAAGVKNENI